MVILPLTSCYGNWNKPLGTSKFINHYLCPKWGIKAEDQALLFLINIHDNTYHNFGSKLFFFLVVVRLKMLPIVSCSINWVKLLTL